MAKAACGPTCDPVISASPSSIGRRRFLKDSLVFSALVPGALVSPQAFSQAPSSTPAEDDRQFWISTLTQVSSPVLKALNQGKLRATMPVEAPHGNEKERRQFTYLEAMGRLLAGISPWLETATLDAAEAGLRQQYADLARGAIEAGTNPKSPDFMNFSQGAQPLVDAAFLTLAILRAPHELWEKLGQSTQQNVVRALESTRVIKPGYNNWLLFSAMIEAGLSFMGAAWDSMRVDYAIRSVDSWYKGDGLYGDGPDFHWDYYNSFVIHPMLLTVLDVMARSSSAWTSYQPESMARAERYAAIQERLISPEGTFPAIGRSLAYRFGAFHLLAEMALRHRLPAPVSPEQVRCAMTAVMRRMMKAPGTFDAEGWLRVGFYGDQPLIGESYISTGSCYLCSVAWLPLGLPETDPFWARPAKPWTAKQIWSGEQVAADHALADGLPQK
jgi:hypothetical protein